MSKITKILKEIETGKTFEVAGKEFIKFADENGRTTAVLKSLAFEDEFGKNNNFAESRVLNRLRDEFLPEIVDAIGEENICEFETDLTALDGLKAYGKMSSKISLPTFDFYRQNVEMFDKHPVNDWWWLATPFSAAPHWDKCPWAECVTPSGRVSYDTVCIDYGVRPILIFVSNISVSCEE